MKKRWGLAAVVLLMLNVSGVPAADLKAGPKVGFSHNFGFGSDFSDDLDAAGTHNDLKLGVSIGGFLEIGLTPGFAIQPEVYYTTSGYSVHDYEDFTQRFIELDALLKGRVGAGEARFLVFAGPDVRIGAGDWTIDVPGLPSINISKSDRDDADLRNTYLGIVGGLGVSFPSGRGELEIEARATVSLQNLDATDGYELKIAAIAVMIGYGFPLR